MILKFTEADRLAATIVEDAWYPTVISQIKPPQNSKSGKSVNIFTTFKIVDGKFSGKEIEVCFNTETKPPGSVLGTMQFFPDNKFIEIAAAIAGKATSEIDIGNIETESLVEKPMDVKWSKTISDGVPLNILSGFLPAGKGNNAVPF